VVAEEGINPFLFQMANIREQCSWVSDGKEATEKAKALVHAAVRRVAYHEPLKLKKVSINPNVLVVGGGIAGIQAALTLAEAGKKVYLVEKEPSIGGNMAKLDKTFPTLDCSACILTPKMSAVKEHSNIEILAYSEVESVEGYVGNFRVKVKRKPRYVMEDRCVGCYQCVEACVFKEPKFPNEFDFGLSKRKPIYIPSQRAIPLCAIIDPSTCLSFVASCSQKCREACERGAIDFEQEELEEELEVGAIIIATGFKPFDPHKVSYYGYGRYENVLTALEFERMLSSDGPSGGKISLKDGREPKTIGIIHCVGSRDENYHEYCSRVCCMYSLKFAHLVKERTNAKVYNFYIDLRAFGKEYEEFYRRVRSEGVRFIRGLPSEIIQEDGKLHLIGENTFLGEMYDYEVDMVILAVGLEPPEDAERLARIFGISRSADGFFLERHPKLAPTSTLTEGIFLAGTCQGPKDIPDSVSSADAAAACALALIDRGVTEIEPYVAWIDEILCKGCQTCIDACPFSAISFDEERKVAVVEEVLCKGCGLCVIECPAHIPTLRHFKDDQILAEVEGVLAARI
jgi:heterodisulfide reductase subunit A